MKLFKSTTLATPTLRKKKRQVVYTKLGLWIVLLCVIVFGFSFLSKLKTFAVQKVTAVGNSIVTVNEIAEIVDKDLEGNYFFLFSKRNILLYQKEKIKNDIAKAFPIFSHVEAKLKGLNILEINITERTPKSLWCSYEAGAADPFTDSCFLMDATGFVYLKAPEFKGNPYIKYYGK